MRPASAVIQSGAAGYSSVMLYLASQSPRRAELLTRLGLSFGRIDLDIPEQRQPGEPAIDYVRRVAREKAVAGLLKVMATPGAVVLGAISMVAGEPRTLPGELRTWVALWYLVLVGSIGLFMLVLIVLARWSATATSYALLPMPLVTVLAGSILLDEPIRLLFVAGGALVLVLLRGRRR